MGLAFGDGSALTSRSSGQTHSQSDLIRLTWTTIDPGRPLAYKTINLPKPIRYNAQTCSIKGVEAAETTMAGYLIERQVQVGSKRRSRKFDQLSTYKSI